MNFTKEIFDILQSNYPDLLKFESEEISKYYDSLNKLLCSSANEFYLSFYEEIQKTVLESFNLGDIEADNNTFSHEFNEAYNELLDDTIEILEYLTPYLNSIKPFIGD